VLLELLDLIAVELEVELVLELEELVERLLWD
jgi:hypothetical protein